MKKSFVCVLVLCALAACGGQDREPNLLNISQSSEEGPDEFAVLPTKPLELPEDLAALPEPSLGASNRTDPTPEADAIAALGGRPQTLSRSNAGDRALLNYTSRFGVGENIREVLAAADLEYRRANDGRLLERWFNVNLYFDSYEPLSLDQYAELERLRRLGIRTSSVPPDPEG